MADFHLPGDNMGTPFTGLIEPRELKLEGYDRNLTHDKQPSHIPKTFIDSMKVREEVFVHEQKWPLKLEYDADDARSCHWVMYASVHRTKEAEVRDPETGDIKRSRRSTTESIPIGTLRVVPFPHPPHPPDGAVFVDGEILPVEDDNNPGRTVNGVNGNTNENVPPSHNTGTGNSASTTGTENPTITAAPATTSSSSSNSSTSSTPRRKRSYLSQVDERRRLSALPFGNDRATDFHNGKEPYIKLGRVAVSPPYRGHGVAEQLWNTAKKWLLAHPDYFNPSVKELGLDKMKVGNAEDIPIWRGLICVHAQEPVVRIYEKWGFKIDKAMGTWYEEGIPHVAMFLRLNVDVKERKIR